MTSECKKGAGQVLLINFGADVGQLNEKLTAMPFLNRACAGSGIETSETADTEPLEQGSVTEMRSGVAPLLRHLKPTRLTRRSGEWLELVGRILQAALLNGCSAPGIAGRCPNPAGDCASGGGRKVAPVFLPPWVKRFCHLDWSCRTIPRAVWSMDIWYFFSLFVDNIAELVLDDEWAAGAGCPW